jgi:mannan endo-1,6-alpha-mannosidase
MWLTRVNGLLGVFWSEFFPEKNGGIFEEVTCEPIEDCNDNALLFKGVTLNWLAMTALLVPSTYNTILPKIQTTAAAAAESCSGGGNNICGVQWYTKKYDNHPGMEQSITATDLFVANMIKFDAGGADPGPVTAKTGGNSTSDPNAGQSEITKASGKGDPVTMADRVGAGFVTVLILGISLGAMGWMIHGT